MSESTEIFYSCNDGSSFISAKGDFTKEELLKMALDQNVIDEGDFLDAEYYQSHFKTTPAPKNSGFKVWNYPVENKCRGSYFASVLRRD